MQCAGHHRSHRVWLGYDIMPVYKCAHSLGSQQRKAGSGARLHCWEYVYASGRVTQLRMSNTGVCCYSPCAIGHLALGSLRASMASEC